MARSGGRKGPALIEQSDALSPSLRRSQNSTIRHAWKALRQNKSRAYLIADAVGRGKSYMALGLAMGLWRSSRKPRYRLLILATSRELSHAWINKLAGPLLREQPFSDLVRVPGNSKKSRNYFSEYLPEFRNGTVKAAIYRLNTNSDLRRFRLARQHPDLAEILPGALSSPSIEILITSPACILKRCNQGFWKRWLEKTDVVIGDELFEAKAPQRLYGALIAKRRGPFRNRRPWLIGLSATVLSRTLSDTESLLKQIINWDMPARRAARQTQALSEAMLQYKDCLEHLVEQGSRDRNLQLVERQTYLKRKTGLERQLRKFMSRVPSRHLRTYQVWAPWQKTTSAPIYATSSFPFQKERLSFAECADELDQAKTEDALQSFAKSALSVQPVRDAPASTTSRQVAQWLKLCEYGLKGESPKRAAFEHWIEGHFVRAEATWKNSLNTSEPIFKLLVYVHHVDTAGTFNPRSKRRDEDQVPLGPTFKIRLQHQLVELADRLKSEDRKLFPSGAHRPAHTLLREELERHRYPRDVLTELRDHDVALLIAALLASRSETKLESKVRAFVKAIDSKPRRKKEPPAIQVLLRDLDLRKKILQNLDLENLSDLHRRRTNSRIPNVVRSAIFRNPDATRCLAHIPVPSELRSRTAQPKLRGKSRHEFASLISDVIGTDEEFLGKLQDWNASRRSLKTFAKKLSDQTAISSKPHNVIEVLTGENPERRKPVTEAFLTPGNPAVLVLTNVCRMGVDLHHYCWDVMHFSPSWTPHDFEQKSGRIDRPRNRWIREVLPIGAPDKRDSIRVHHFVWPFTYDERIIRRMNFRGHFSERLLATEGKSLERFDEDDLKAEAASRRFKLLPPLDLKPT